MTRVLIAVAAGWIALAWTAAPVVAQQAARPAPRTSEAVLLLDVVDVSGTMAKAIDAMTQAEIGQLSRTLQPGDLYARVAFAGTARATALQKIAEGADIDRVIRLLAQPEAKGAKTSISRGLLEAQQIVEREGVGRHVVLLLATDGLNDPPDGTAAEAARMAEATAWWRDRPDTDRIVVGVQASGNGDELRSLAEGLGATLVTIAEYGDQLLVERAIAEARTPQTTAPLPTGAWPWWVWWMIAAALIGVASLVALGKRAATEAPAQTPASGAQASTKNPRALELVVVISAQGRVQRVVIPAEDADGEIATLGTTGSVFVPDLVGRQVRVLRTPEGATIVADPASNIRVNGESIGAPGYVLAQNQQVRISHKAVAVTLELRDARQHGPREVRTEKAPARIKVSAVRRSA